MKRISIVLLMVVLCSVGYGATDEESYSQWMQQGKNQVTQGNLEEARDSFQNALVFKPNDAEAKKGIRLAEERMVSKAPEPEFKASAKGANNKAQKDFSIRVSLGNAPGIDEVEDSTDTYSANDDGGARVEVLAVKRWWSKNNPNIGGSFGGGIFFGSHALSEPGVDVDLTTFGGMIQGGFIAKAGENFVFEVGPYLGIGIANNETTGYSDGTGSYGLFGVKGGAFVLIGDNIELGLELGYEGFAHVQEYEDFGIIEEVTFSGSGARVAAILAVKF